jgi:hypothetical protein
VVAAVDYGDRGEAVVEDWLERELDPLFGGQSRRVAFAGYIQAMRKQ